LKAALLDPHSHSKIKTAFNSYDLDRNGYLTRAEFGTFAVNLLTILETGPGGPELKKMLGIKTPTQFANEMFDAADWNGDKKISFSEFESLVNSHRSF
jgi:Ca2+-binding EF-hand superfamily protein